MHSSSGKLASSDVVLHFFGFISLHLCSVLAPPSGGWHSLNPCSNPVVNYLKNNPVKSGVQAGRSNTSILYWDVFIMKTAFVCLKYVMVTYERILHPYERTCLSESTFHNPLNSKKKKKPKTWTWTWTKTHLQ